MKRVALLGMLCALLVAGAGCGSSGHHSKLREEQEHLRESTASYRVTLGIDEVAIGEYAKAKRDFQSGCPADPPWELIEKAEAIEREEPSMSFAEYEQAVESLC